jgi:hypothetical protein
MTVAAGAFAATDLMPFSIAEGDEYISLFPARRIASAGNELPYQGSRST